MILRKAKYILPKGYYLKENRSSRRSSVELAASFGAVANEIISPSFRVIDVSTSGLSFISKEKIALGDMIELQVEITEKYSVTLKVKVIWIKYFRGHKEYRIGVQIIDKNTPDFQKFLEYCSSLIQ